MPSNKGGTKVDNVVPINPAQARQKLDCIATMREALEDAYLWIDPSTRPKCKSNTLMELMKKIEEALKEESEK